MKTTQKMQNRKGKDASSREGSGLSVEPFFINPVPKLWLAAKKCSSGFGRYLAILCMLFAGTTVKAQLAIITQPTSIATCQPASSTPFTTSFRVGRGAGCGNLASAANVTFIWEYFNGTAWVALANNVPSGFTYSNGSVRTGSGANAEITNTLTFTLSSSAATGGFSYRCRANQPTGCTGYVTSNTITFTVYAKPVVTFTAQPGAASCVNTDVTYSTQAGQSGYTWGIPGVSGTDYTITGGSLSSNSITLRWLTAGSKTVTINYSNANGCPASTSTSSTATTVITQATPGFTAAPSGSICAATDVTYTTEAGQSAYVWSYSGSENIDYSITSGGAATDNTVTVQWLTPGSKAVSVGYTAAGCNASVPVSSGDITVTALPVATFSTAASASSCSETDVTYTTQPGQSLYVWNLPGTLHTDYTIIAGGTGSSSNTVTVQWLSAGNKTVTVNYTGADGCATTGPAVSTTTVIIPAVPTIAASGSTSFCAGGSVTLNASTASGHQWYDGGVLIPGATGISHVAVTSGVYTVIALDAAGCEAESAETIVTVNSLPTINTAAQAGSLCVSTTAQVTGLAYTSTSNNPVSYSIAWDAAATTAGFSPVVDAVLPATPIEIAVPANAPAADYSGSITVTNADGCTSLSNAFLVTITSPPSLADLAITASDACVGAGSIITVNSATLLDGTYTVAYDLDGSNPSAANSTSMSFSSGSGNFATVALNNTGSTGITITEIALIGCNAIPVLGNTANLTVHALPTVAAVTGPNDVCVGNSVILSNSTTGGTWLSGDMGIATVDNSGLVTGMSAGAVDIIYTTLPNADGCSNVAVKNIIVNTLPSVTPITGPASVCINTSASLQNSTAGGTWKSSNTTVASIDAAGVVSGLATGTAVITYIFPANASGCTDSTTVMITVDPAASADAGADIVVCTSSSPAAITLNDAAFGGSASTAAWSILAGGGVLSSIDQTASPSAITYTAAAGFSGTVTLLLTTNKPGSCIAATSIKTITVSEVPAVSAGPTITVCQSSSPLPVLLGGAVLGGSAVTGAWSIISGGGTLSTDLQTADPATVTYTPAINYSGAAILRLTSDVASGCAAAFSQRTINITTAPTVNAGTPVLTCADISQTASGVAAVNITAGSSAANYTTVLWSSSGTGTFANPASLTTATYTPSAADRAAGFVTLTLTATGNAPCGTATSSKTFTITPAIDGNSSNNWTQVPDCNGLGVRFVLPAAPGGGNGVFSYQWMQKNNCGTAGVSTPVPGATGPSFIPPADNCYWLFISSGGCSVPQALVGGTTRLRPSTDTALLSNVTFGVGGSNPSICTGSSTTLTAQSSVAYTYAWSPATGLSATTGASVIANPASTTVYTVTATATDGTGCTKTVTNTVTVSPVTVAGTLPAAVSACTSAAAVLNLTGNTGSVSRWESSTNGGTTWVPIANTATSLNYTLAAQTTYYRALVQSGACAAAYSPAVRTGLQNVWAGRVSSDWQVPVNWSDSTLPSLSCPNVTIPAATPYSPLLNAGVATINNLVINPAAFLTVTDGLMQVAGSISNSGTFDVSNGSLEFNGTAAQQVAGNMFAANTVKNITVSNPNGLTVENTPGNLLNIRGDLSFGNINNSTLHTGDNVVLLSAAGGTARLADITNNGSNTGNAVSGKMVIQRYIPGRRAWRLLTAPITASSQVRISDSWQEAAARVTDPAVISAASNPNPGYGTHVTYGFPSTNGYDQGVNGNASVFYLTGTGWNGVPTATNNGAVFNSGYITDQPGYMLFVRGDRGTLLSQATAAVTSPTVLRMKGNIHTGLLDLPLGSGMLAGSSHFRVIGNPYPSALDFHKVVANGPNTLAGFADAFYLWDPNITGSNAVGGWVAMSYNSISGIYDRTVLTGGSPGVDSSGHIQSGSAFVIDYTGAATSLRIQEPNKVSGSNNSQFRPVGRANQVRVSLLAKNADNSISINDALLVNYDDTYSNEVDNADMKKLSNFAENFSVKNAGKLLMIEKRARFVKADTIQFQMWKMKAKQYQLQLNLEHFNAPAGAIAVLEDKFLLTKTTISTNGTSEYNFTVNSNSASADSNRFRLLFRPVADFIGPVVSLSNKDALVEWTIADEFNISQFIIERSKDGTVFIATATVEPKGNSEVPYQWKDLDPAPGNYFYRIKAVSSNGAFVYSNTVSIKIMNNRAGMFVFPNPVIDNVINLQINSMKPGRYSTKLLTATGGLVQQDVLTYPGGIAAQLIRLKQQVPPGSYLLQVSDINGKSVSLKLAVQ